MNDTEKTRMHRYLMFALPGLLFAIIAVSTDLYLHGTPMYPQSFQVGPFELYTSTGILVGATVVVLPLWVQFIRGGGLES